MDTLSCITSLNNSFYNSSFFVIVDNASNKQERNRLYKASVSQKNCKYIQANTNLGFSSGNNIGIKYAINHNADFILLLNNDTIVTPAFLSNLLDTYQKVSEKQQTDKLIFSPKINYFYDKKKIWFCGGMWNKYTGRTTHIGINEKDDGQYKDPFRVSFLSGCCILIPAQAIKEVGLMSEDYFLYCEDTDYSLRLMDAGYQLWVDPSSLIYHKVSASTGGNASDTYTYYSVRNKQYLIDKFIKIFYRPLSRAYSKLEIRHKVKKGEYKQDVVYRALRDHKEGITGRVEL